MLKFPTIIGFLFITFMVIFLFIYNDYKKFSNTPIIIDKPFIINITPGMSFHNINKIFIENNLIKKPNYFKFIAYKTKKANKIKFGEYEIKSGLLPEEILNILVFGKVIQYSLTLVEGFNVHDLLNKLKDNDILIKKINYDKHDTLIAQLGKPESNAEGLFFPDTYYFPKGTTDIEFLLRSYNNLQDILKEEWGRRAKNLPYKNPYEALIMASIIEKESSLIDELSIISGVFLKRLDVGMKLQTDPTVIYAMKENFKGNIRKKDLLIDSPYNTYLYKGLPPTPIGLAGRNAIHAALHPKKTDYLYFVAKGNGSHHFSNSLTEHNRAVSKYQLKVKND